MAGNGKGSIEKRDKDGYTWKLIISNGYSKEGKKIRQTRTVKVDGRTFDTRKKAAERQLSLFLAETEKTDYIEPSKYTIEDFVAKWLEEYASKNLEHKTFYRYKELLQGRFCEVLGYKKLQELKPMHLLEFYGNLQESGIRKDMKYIAKPTLKELIKTHNIELDQLASSAGISIRTLNGVLSGNTTITAMNINIAISKIISEKSGNTTNIKLDNIFSPASEPKPLSNKTIQHYHKAISSMLNDAVQWQLIPSNPAARVQPPKVTKKEMPCFNEDQADIMLDALENEPLKYRLLITLALATGARRGELIALEWKNIDTDKNTIRIIHSVQYIPSKGLTIKEPKNKTSNRLISIPKSTMTLLKEYKVVQNAERVNAGDQWKGDEDDNIKYVFTTCFGEIMHPDTVSSWFPEFLKRHTEIINKNETIKDDEKKLYTLPITNSHSLRHSAATLLINQGLNVRALSNRLGHANTSTTMNIYSHALQSADKQAADMMENIITGKKNKSNETKHA